MSRVGVLTRQELVEPELWLGKRARDPQAETGEAPGPDREEKRGDACLAARESPGGASATG